MTPVQIAYLKHFLYDKSLARNYIGFYRKYHLKGSPSGDKDANPESIEQFFLKTSVEDVIMHAFTFRLDNDPNQYHYTYDYWKDVDDKWQVYMKQNENNFNNDSWPELRKTFAILRMNWDLPRYWSRDNLESTEEVYKRMNITLPLPDFLWKHGSEYKPEVTSTVDEQEQCEEPEEEKKDELEIEFVVFNKARAFGLQLGTISVNNKHSPKVTINRTDTTVVKAKKARYAMIGRTKAGDVVIQLCGNTSGVPINLSTDGYCQINSRQFVENIRRMLSLKNELEYLRIECISNKIDSITYKVTKQL